jgi:hypothetical protein
MRQASKRVADSAEKTVRDIRRATRRHHSAGRRSASWKMVLGCQKKRTPSALTLGVAKLLPQLGF